MFKRKSLSGNGVAFLRPLQMRAQASVATTEAKHFIA